MLRAVSPARAASFTLVALACFAVAGVGVQLLRIEHDWWQAPLSFYLSGPYSGWLRLAYALLGLAMAVLATGLWAALAPAARRQLVSVLLPLGGLALIATAYWPGPSPGHPVSDAGALVHGLAAMAAFLLVGAAMLLQSAVLRHDPYWRPVAAPLLAVAALAFAGLWLHALWRELPRGASQKAVIALYLLWLCGVALRLRSLPAAGRDAGRDTRTTGAASR